MTPQEQQMIDGLISRIRNTQVQNKDSEAEQHIQQGLGSDPDALYVLTQTVLVQQYGLEQAQSQLSELKQQNQTLQDQLAQAQQGTKSSSGSFLSHIFGSGNSGSQPPAPAQSSQYQPVNNPGYGNPGYGNPGYGNPGYGNPGYPPPPPPPPVVYPQQSYPGGGMFGGGGGGFLQGALQTAAGVAAGEMVFQGMEDLFHGFGGHHSGYGLSGGGGGGETIVNNYYDDDRGAGERRDERLGDDGGRDDAFYNPSDDASRNDVGDDLAASDADSSSLDDTGGDDAGFDDNAGDDFSSSDDNS